MYEAFDRYDCQDVCDRIDFLRMESSEYAEEFLNQFLHLCCEFPEGVHPPCYKRNLITQGKGFGRLKYLDS